MVIVAALIVIGVTVSLVRRRSTGGLAVVMLRQLVERSSPSDQDWISAMLAEHEAIDDPGQRRRFARGCLRAVVFAAPPRSAGSTAAGFVGLLAAGAVGLVGYGWVRYPSIRTDGWWPIYLAVFVAAIAAYAVFGLIAARTVTPATGWAALGVALPMATYGWWIAHPNVISAPAFLLPTVPSLLVAGYLSYRRRRFAETAAAAVIESLTAGFAAGFAVFIANIATTYSTVRGTGNPTNELGDSLAAAVLLLLLIPITASCLSLAVIRLAQPGRPGKDSGTTS